MNMKIVLLPLLLALNVSHAETLVSTGSGCAIGSNLVLTAYHIIDGAQKIKVTFNGGQSVDAVVQDGSQRDDWAVLQISGYVGDWVDIDFDTATSLGAKVYTLGYPNSTILGQDLKYSEGSVNALSGLGNNTKQLQISVPIQPGNSGGPLFDERHELVGMIMATIRADVFFESTGGALPQNVNFAVKATSLPDRYRHRRKPRIATFKHNQMSACFIRVVSEAKCGNSATCQSADAPKDKNIRSKICNRNPNQRCGQGQKDVNELFGLKLNVEYDFGGFCAYTHTDKKGVKQGRYIPVDQLFGCRTYQYELDDYNVVRKISGCVVVNHDSAHSKIQEIFAWFRNQKKIELQEDEYELDGTSFRVDYDCVKRRVWRCRFARNTEVARALSVILEMPDDRASLISIELERIGWKRGLSVETTQQRPTGVLACSDESALSVNVPISLFGKVIGEIEAVSDKERKSQDNFYLNDKADDKMYIMPFPPKKKFLNFSRYTCRLSPATFRIVNIVASCCVQTRKDAECIADRAIALLQKKFNTIFDSQSKRDEYGRARATQTHLALWTIPNTNQKECPVPISVRGVSVSYGRFDKPSGEEEWNVWIKLEDTLMDEIVHLENESLKKRSVTQKDEDALDAL